MLASPSLIENYGVIVNWCVETGKIGENGVKKKKKVLEVCIVGETVTVKIVASYV